MIDGLVSVVIPTYKRSEMLTRAIQSILNQSYYNTEIIVVDDNEPNDEFSLATQAKLKEIKDARVRYIQQEKHINGSAARNVGIDAAAGEYIAFLDDDDVWYPDKLEKQMKIFSASPEVGLVYTGSKAIYVNDKVSYAIVPKRKGNLKREILLGNCIGTTSTVVVKRDVIVAAGKFDIQMPALQDYDLWIRICQLTQVGYVQDEEIDYYNFRNGVQVSSNTEKYETAFARLNEKYRDLMDCLDEAEKKKRQEYELFLLANKALRNNDKKKGRSYLKKVLSNGFNKKAVAMLLMSPFRYTLTLKLRKMA